MPGEGAATFSRPAGRQPPAGPGPGCEAHTDTCALGWGTWEEVGAAGTSPWHTGRGPPRAVPSTLGALGTVRSARPSQLPGGELDFWGGCGHLPGRHWGWCSAHPRVPRSREELGCRAHPLSAPSCARSPAASCSARAPAVGPSTSPASGCPGRRKGASSAASVSQASAVRPQTPGSAQAAVLRHPQPPRCAQRACRSLGASLRARCDCCQHGVTRLVWGLAVASRGRCGPGSVEVAVVAATAGAGNPAHQGHGSLESCRLPCGSVRAAPALTGLHQHSRRRVGRGCTVVAVPLLSSSARLLGT